MTWSSLVCLVSTDNKLHSSVCRVSSGVRAWHRRSIPFSVEDAGEAGQNEVKFEIGLRYFLIASKKAGNGRLDVVGEPYSCPTENPVIFSNLTLYDWFMLY